MKYPNLILIFIYSFLSNLAMADVLPIEVNGKWGFINQSGEVIVEPEYAKSTSYGKIGTTLEYKKDDPSKTILRLYDEDGKVLLKTNSAFFHTTRQYARKYTYFRFIDNNKYGIVDSLGNIVFSAQFDKIESSSEEGTAIFVNDDKFGMLDVSGKILLPAEYKTKEELMLDYINSLYNFKRTQFRSIQFVNDDLIPVYAGTIDKFGSKNQDRWGFADHDGKIIIPVKYSRVEPFRNHVAVVKKGEKYGLIDRSGKIILPTEYTYVSGIIGNRIWAYKENKLKTTSFIFDYNGELLSKHDGKFISLYIHDREDLSNFVMLSTDGKGTMYASEGIGLIDISTGEMVLPTSYFHIQYLGNGMISYADSCLCENMGKGALYTVTVLGYTGTATGCKFSVLNLENREVVFDNAFRAIAGFSENGNAWGINEEAQFVSVSSDQSMVVLPQVNVQPYRDSYSIALGYMLRHISQFPEDYILYQGRILHAYEASEVLGDNGEESDFMAITRINQGIHQLTIGEESWGYIDVENKKIIWWSESPSNAVKDWLKNLK